MMKYTIWFLLLVFAANLANAQDKGQTGLFIVKPYLQIGRSPSAQSLDILWHVSDVNADWVVEEKNSDKEAWKKTDDVTFNRIAVAGIEPHRVYKAQLTGLTPGGTFRYRVIKDGKAVFSSDGKAPKSTGQDYRFIVAGDVGAATSEQKLIAMREYEAKPDFVIVPGDIVYENGLISEYRTKFWNIYNASQADAQGVPLMSSVPYITAPGNHDTYARDLDKNPDALAYFMFWDQPLNGPTGAAVVPAIKGSDVNKKAFLDAAGQSYPRMANYSFDYGNAHWLVLDANPYVDWTNSELVEWVKKDLASAKNATWRFVTFHQPGFNSSHEHFEQQHMRLLSPIFEAGKVDVVFNGHVHNYQRSYPLTFVPYKKSIPLLATNGETPRGRLVEGTWKLDKSFDGKTKTKPNGIIYLVTGAGGQELYNPEQQDDPDSWLPFTYKFISKVHSLTVVDVHGTTLFVRQLAADGKELDSFSVAK